MRLGAQVEVLDPPELRAMMIQTINELSALYARGGAPAAVTGQA
jgi:hypothetical protein